MDKKQIAKKLDTLASNVAKKGIFVVSKKDNLYIVQEHITKQIIASDIPMRNVAEYICRFKNKGKDPAITTLREIKDLISRYFKYKSDIMYYKNTLKSSKDSFRLDAAEARLIDTIARLNYTRYELQRYR
jgi:hypothetical protein